MTDIESRLRAAMHSVADQPPVGLLDKVRRRHRRHRERVAVGCAAVVLAIAIGAQPVAHALRASNRGQTSSGRVQPGGRIILLPMISGLGQFNPGGRAAGRHAAPTATHGTVLAGCTDANVGSIGENWRATARPLASHTLWFISAGVGEASRHSSGLKIDPGVMVIAGARPWTTVVVKVAPSGRGRLRFLYGPHDSLAAGTRYTARSGEDGVTFVACPARTGIEPEPRNVTIYWGAFLIRRDSCVPVNVWLPGRKSPVRAGLGYCGPLQPGLAQPSLRDRGARYVRV